MYVLLTKKKEDAHFVWYIFYTKIDTPYEDSKTVYGLIKFNKIEETNIDSLEIIKEESDNLYDNYKRIKRHCIYLMCKCKTSNEYPSEIQGAFGG